MKLILVAFFLAATSAHASYFHTKCSNASGSVKWESGHNSNSLTFTYYNNRGPQTKNVSLNQVNVDVQEVATIKSERQNDCSVSSIASSTEVTAGKVTITPSEEAPNSLDLVEKKIETEVICETHFNSMMHCPRE